MSKDPALRSNVYLIRLTSPFEDFYKIGTSVHKYCRFYQIMQYGYGVEIVYSAMGFDMGKAYRLESELHSQFDNHAYIPSVKFPGYLECYKGINIEAYKSIFNDLAAQNYTYIENLPITWR